MKVTSRTTLAVIVAALALMISAGAGATASLLITGKQIKDGSLTSADVKNSSLKAKDFSKGAKAKLKGATGPAGPAGPRGATGATGPAGASALSGFEVITRSIPVPGLSTVPTDLSAACPAGKKALAASAGYANPVTQLLSQVTRTAEDSFKASGLNLLPTSQVLTLDVVCANLPG